jgi:hypothetical protein
MRHRGLAASLFLAIALTTGCSSDNSFPLRTYPMGEKVQLGHLSYTVFETQWMTHLGEGVNDRVPQNRFFLIRLSVVNSGSSDAIVPTLTITDDQGRSYPEISNGEGVPQWVGYLRQPKPAESVQGNAVFDAPPGHYKLRIMDETETKPADVDIPFSFGSETPEMAVPETGPAKR